MHTCLMLLGAEVHVPSPFLTFLLRKRPASSPTPSAAAHVRPMADPPAPPSKPAAPPPASPQQTPAPHGYVSAVMLCELEWGPQQPLAPHRYVRAAVLCEYAFISCDCSSQQTPAPRSYVSAVMLCECECGPCVCSPCDYGCSLCECIIGKSCAGGIDLVLMLCVLWSEWGAAYDVMSTLG
eukprot:1144721-Pelagomonas_calceolata.AAC.2